MEADLARMEAVMLQMNVPDTETVKRAEAEIRKVMKEDASIPVLFHLLRFSSHVSVRQFAAVLLRLYLMKIWNGMNADDRSGWKRFLLESIAGEQVKVVSLNTAHVISMLAKIEMADGPDGWRELLEFLTRFAQSSEPRQQELAMWVFYAITETVGTVFQPHFSELKRLYASILLNTQDTQVRIAALKATAALLDFLGSGDDVLEFRDLIPLLLKGLESNIGDEALAPQILEVLSQMAEKPIPILNKFVRETLQVVILVIESDEADFGTKKVAVHTFSTLLQFKSRFVSKLNMIEPFLRVAVRCVAMEYSRYKQLLMAKEVSHDGEMKVKKSEGQDEDDDEHCDFGMTVVSAITQNLPTRQTFEAVMQLVSIYIQKPTPAFQPDAPAPEPWIALCLLLHAIEGLAEEITERQAMGDLVQLVMDQAQRNPHPLIRATAFLCVVEWTQFLFEDFQAFMPKVLQIATLGMEDHVVFVRLCAGDVVELICDDISEEALLPDAEVLFQKLLQLCRPEVHPDVVSSALAALSSVMVTVGAHSMPFFGQIVSILSGWAERTEDIYLTVRGHAFYAFGSLALAMSRTDDNGNDNLGAFIPLLDPIFACAAKTLESEDMESTQLIYSAFGNIVDALGERSSPYLPRILETLLTSQFLDEGAQVDVTDRDGMLVPESVRNRFRNSGDESQNEEDIFEEDEEELHYQPGVSYELSMRMEVLEAKQQAVYAIGRVAQNAPAQDLLPFLENMLDICLVSMDHVFPSLKSTSINALGLVTRACLKCFPGEVLSEAAKKSANEWAVSCLVEPEENRKWIPGVPTQLSPQIMTILDEKVLPSMAGILTDEDNETTVGTCCETLANLILDVGPGILALQSHFETLTEGAIILLNGEGACQVLAKDDDADDDEEEDEGTSEAAANELFDNTCDLLSAIAQVTGPRFESLARRLLSDLGNGMGSNSKRIASSIGAFNQIVIALGMGGCAPFANDMLNLALAFLEHEYPLVRQNAAFLVGNLVLLAGDHFVSKNDSIMKALRGLDKIFSLSGRIEQLVGEYEGSSEMPDEVTDLQAVLDNACGAVARIFVVLLRANLKPPGQFVDKLLNMMPLRVDMMENFPIFHCLNLMMHSASSRDLVANRGSQLVVLVGSTLEKLEDEDRSFPLAKSEMRSILKGIFSANESQAASFLNSLSQRQVELIRSLSQE